MLVIGSVRGLFADNLLIDRLIVGRLAPIPQYLPMPENLAMLSRLNKVWVDWLLGRTPDEATYSDPLANRIRELPAEYRTAVEKTVDALEETGGAPDGPVR